MKPFRVFLMLAALMATASAIQAQSVSSASLQAMRRAAQYSEVLTDLATPFYVQRGPQYFPPSPPPPKELKSLEEAAQSLRVRARYQGDLSGTIEIPSATVLTSPEEASEPAQSDCPARAAASWYTQAVQQSNAVMQRLRAICTGESATCQAAAGCCEPACGLSVVIGCAKSCEMVQAPNGCCCAKECGCCEACKAKKAKTAQLQPFPTVPNSTWAPPPAPYIGSYCSPLHIPGHPMPPPGMQVRTEPIAPPGTGIWYHPCPMPPSHGARVIELATIAPRPSVAHLVTPDLDAHCERMPHRGDVVILEGNVLLLCKKHAQPIRIEAQRVIVNMKDGSFTVESDPRPTTATSSFGVMRTSGLEILPSHVTFEMFLPAQSFTPQNRVIQMPAERSPSNWQR